MTKHPDKPSIMPDSAGTGGPENAGVPGSRGLFGGGDDAWAAELDAWDASLPIASEPAASSVEQPASNPDARAPTPGAHANVAPASSPLAAGPTLEALPDFAAPGQEPITAARQAPPEVRAALAATEIPDVWTSGTAPSEAALSAAEELKQETPTSQTAAPLDPPPEADFSDVPTASGMVVLEDTARPSGKTSSPASEAPDDVAAELRRENTNVMWRSAAAVDVDGQAPGPAATGRGAFEGPDEPTLDRPEQPTLDGNAKAVLRPSDLIALDPPRREPFGGAEEPTVDRVSSDLARSNEPVAQPDAQVAPNDFVAQPVTQSHTATEAELARLREVAAPTDEPAAITVLQAEEPPDSSGENGVADDAWFASEGPPPKAAASEANGAGDEDLREGTRAPGLVTGLAASTDPELSDDMAAGAATGGLAGTISASAPEWQAAEPEIEILREPATASGEVAVERAAIADFDVSTAEPFVEVPHHDLPELKAERWANPNSFVAVPAQADPPEASRASLDDQLARSLAELESCPDEHRRASLALAAAFAAERLGDDQAAFGLCERALVADPTCCAAARAVFRMHERRGEREQAYAALARLTSLAGESAEKQHYEAMLREWAAALRQPIPECARDAGPDRFSQALCDAEVALDTAQTATATRAMGIAADLAGGPLAAALHTAAARLDEFSGAADRAAEHLRTAREVDPTAQSLAVAFGELRWAARAPEALDVLESCLSVLPPSALRDSVARWAAQAARKRGDRARAANVLKSTTPSRAALRDRLELLEQSSPEDIAALCEQIGDPKPGEGLAACLWFRRAELAVAGGRFDEALNVIEQAMRLMPPAVPVAMIAERIARSAESAQVKARAYTLWATGDPARRAFAMRSHADLLSLGGDRHAAVELLRQAVAAAPGDSSFWLLAQHDVLSGRPEQAAVVLDAGADAWGASPLTAALRERAAELRALTATDESVQRLRILANYPGADRNARWTWGRAALASGAPPLMDVYYTDEARATLDPERRAAVLTARSVLLGDDRQRAREMRRAALSACPGFPPAFALELLDRSQEPEQVSAVLLESAVGEDGGLRRYEAACWLAQAGRTVEAMRIACDLLEADGEWEAARELLRRLVSVAADAPFRLELLERASRLLATPEWTLVLAEALENSGDFPRAAQVYRTLTDSPVAADAELGLLRSLRAMADGQALCDLFHARGQALLDRAPERAAEAFLEQARAASELRGDRDEALQALDLAFRASPLDPELEMARFLELAKAGRYYELIPILGNPSPDESLIASGSLTVAELLDAGCGGGSQSESIAQTSAREGFERRSTLVRALSRAIDREGFGPGTAAIMERLAEACRSPLTSAILLTRAADVHATAGDSAAAEKRLRQAITAKPDHLPALVRLARLLTLRSDWGEAVDSRQRVAEALSAPDLKRDTLLEAAALADERLGDKTRAIALLRGALESDPSSEEAFARLRGLLEATGGRDELAQLLALRMTQASNPFEMASLRLARAELLAKDEGGRPAAVIELQTLLQKDPQNARALARLAELQTEDGAHAEAADLYLKLAGVESDPARLEDVYLRLARLYSKELHDPARAVGAYLRVLQLDADHLDALRALSDLYTEQQDTKSGIAVTDRLVQALGTSAERLRYLVRLGQLWEQAGDLRRSGSYLKRAASEAPRDADAVTELAHFYERTRDMQSRRIVLDRSITLLREDLRTKPNDGTALAALERLLQTLPAPASAAAAAQLRASLTREAPRESTLTTERREDTARSRWASQPRPLSRLLKLGDQVFPPELPPALRAIFNLVGDTLARSYRSDVKQWDVGRDDRPRRGDPLRETVQQALTDVGVGEVDLYVKSAMPPLLVLEPGDPPCLIVGATLLRGGPAALRFIAGRSAALLATHLDLAVRGTPADLGVMLMGLIRLFVPDFELTAVDDEAKLAEAQARLARVLPRRLRPELMPYVVELSGTLEFATIHSAIRRWANWMGLLACGDLKAAIGVLAAVGGRPAPPGMLPNTPEATWLMEFALSPDYDRLVSLADGRGLVE